MLRSRVIPSLLLYEKGLIKTKQFERYKYVGDPINAIKIFNEKEVDELIILDISSTKNNSSISFHESLPLITLSVDFLLYHFLVLQF